MKEFKGSHELNGHQQLLFKRGDTVVINMTSFLNDHKDSTPVLDLTQSSSSLADSKDVKLKFLAEHYRPKYMHGTIGHRKGWFPIECV